MSYSRKFHNCSQPEQINTDRFWDKYIDFLKKSQIHDKSLVWYVKHAEQYIKAFPDKRLKAHTAANIDEYLDHLGKNNRVQSWQYMQQIDAIQKLFQFIDVPLAKTFAWEDRLLCAQNINSSHDTLVRESPLILEQSNDSSNITSIDMQVVHKKYAREIQNCTTEIRRRSYSIRTEKAYIAWLSRFFLFTNCLPVEKINESHIVAFLQSLAVNNYVSASTQNQALNRQGML
ncbi:MAG TPA: hypothetical protein ENJ28_03615 [Gammaproteobacteria bacterium]|nr:hypothetical protein [Gammaproteobacteria bacterium]